MDIEYLHKFSFQTNSKTDIKILFNIWKIILSIKIETGLQFFFRLVIKVLIKFIILKLKLF